MSKHHVKHTQPIDFTQVRNALLHVLNTYVPLGIKGRNLDDEMLWDILLYASVHQTTMETACNELDGVPSGNTMREHLNAALDESHTGILELERRLNQALRAQLPRAFVKQLGQRTYAVAIDLVEIPYHGQPQQDQDEVRRGRAKSGTTHFHVYATLAIVHDQRRYALALTFVWADEPLVQVLERLVKQAQKLGLGIRCAYLDKGFFSSKVLRWLRRHRIPYIIPVPLRGKGLRALCRGRRSYRTRYTFNAGTATAYTTDLVLVRKYSRGRRGRHQVDWLVYAVYGVDQIPPHQIHELYRRRFGIESGYRQMHQVRARTASRNPAVRLLLFGLAVLILNIYIALRRVWLTIRHFGRRTRRGWLTLKRLALMFMRLIERLWGVSAVEQVVFSRLNPKPIS